MMFSNRGSYSVLKRMVSTIKSKNIASYSVISTCNRRYPYFYIITPSLKYILHYFRGIKNNMTEYGTLEIRKVLKQGDAKIVIIPKHSEIDVGDYCLIKKVKEHEVVNNE